MEISSLAGIDVSDSASLGIIVDTIRIVFVKERAFPLFIRVNFAIAFISHNYDWWLP